jgi:hypothetical protein
LGLSARSGEDIYEQKSIKKLTGFTIGNYDEIYTLYYFVCVPVLWRTVGFDQGMFQLDNMWLQELIQALSSWGGAVGLNFVKHTADISRRLR